MKFEIVGLEDNYGNHRFSNNAILSKLAESVDLDESLSFVWWVEKVFINDEYRGVAEELGKRDWFGVMHVPMLTPNWAQYSQNNISKMYYSDAWRQAMGRCKGIVVFSDHMKQQVKSVYPRLNVFSLKHPVGHSDCSFNFEKFEAAPRVLLVGAWLRNFESFYYLNTEFKKTVLLNKYAEGYLRDVNSKYSVDILSKVRELECIQFLENNAYDELFSSSLIFLDLYETSANNALIECLAYDVPFVAKRHPAIVEYVGEDYPLFIEDVSEFSNITTNAVFEAHKYLKKNKQLKESLSIDEFVKGISVVYQQIEGVKA